MRLLTYAVFTALLLPCAAANAQRSFDVDILRDTFGFDESTKMSVELNMLHQGCSARDCIPSIDNPKFVSAEDASHVADDAIVITLSYKGKYRAYPARILDHHEIVNDAIAGDRNALGSDRSTGHRWAADRCTARPFPRFNGKMGPLASGAS